MRIRISIARQTLVLSEDSGQVSGAWPVSTSSRGLGERNGSCCTPRGKHIVRAKIGAGQPMNAVFSARRPTGEIYSPSLASASPGRDWILTRILWLSGLDSGKNRLGDVDTMRRYIYIHGCPDSVSLLFPGSHGCVRMRNADVVELFDFTPIHTLVEIAEI
ncbi:MAG: L,D-transpeptidase [Candidatus Accumulibacter sp.]|jgi:lipoprotein-anchoring transpeptidase ErfK/SrfK|nr:L,D-transpeptidase [Accumulibacter sp.]